MRGGGEGETCSFLGLPNFPWNLYFLFLWIDESYGLLLTITYFFFFLSFKLFWSCWYEKHWEESTPDTSILASDMSEVTK